MYRLFIENKLDKKLEKLYKSNKKRVDIINNKCKEILVNPYRYKSLRNVLKKIRRVHIDSHFVLIFEIDEVNKIVKLLDFDHHDKIYKKN